MTDDLIQETAIDDPAIVRERVLGIIDHNTGGRQPDAARVSSIFVIATHADLAPTTVRSVLNDLADEGVIDQRTTATGETRVSFTEGV